MAKLKLKDPKKVLPSRKTNVLEKYWNVTWYWLGWFTNFHYNDISTAAPTNCANYCNGMLEVLFKAFFLSFETLSTKLYSSFHSLLLRILMKN